MGKLTFSIPQKSFLLFYCVRKRQHYCFVYLRQELVIYHQSNKNNNNKNNNKKPDRVTELSASLPATTDMTDNLSLHPLSEPFFYSPNAQTDTRLFEGKPTAIPSTKQRQKVKRARRHKTQLNQFPQNSLASPICARTRRKHHTSKQTRSKKGSEWVSRFLVDYTGIPVEVNKQSFLPKEMKYYSHLQSLTVRTAGRLSRTPGVQHALHGFRS